MKKILTILLCAITLALSAQNKKADDILKMATDKLNSFKTVEAEFTYDLINSDGETNDSGKGTLLINGDKYRLSIVGQQVICDGSTIWTYIEDAEEVQINEVAEGEEDAINPSNLLTFYNNNYKAKHIAEDVIGGNTVYIISLKPNEDKNISKANLFIKKDDLQIMKVVLDDKNGGQTVYTITNFIPEKEVSEKDFSFNEADYPDVDIIDMR